MFIRAMYYTSSYPAEASGIPERQLKFPPQRPEPPGDPVQAPTDHLRLSGYPGPSSPCRFINSVTNYGTGRFSENGTQWQDQKNAVLLILLALIAVDWNVIPNRF